MILCIDASNIRAGGGVTHLAELLSAADPHACGFKQVIVWSGTATLAKIEDRNWLKKFYDPLLDCDLPYRIFWQRFKLRKLAVQAGCDVLFVPGGSDLSGFKPVATLSQNLLPFEWYEMKRYGWSVYTLKFMLLRWTQGNSFRKSDGVIFLTQYARDAILKVIGKLRGLSAIIPHGINPRFFRQPRPQRLPVDFNERQPCRLLYVSIIEMYKHQWQVAEAVAQLRSEGIPVILEFIGPPAGGISRLKEAIKRVDPGGAFITYRGSVPYENLDEFYTSADIGVFASSCENMPNILLEGMAAGLPMACSKMGPMPEVLGDAGVYFDPENPSSIAAAIRRLIESPGLRRDISQAGFKLAQQYSWHRCSGETLAFLAQIAQMHLRKS